MDLNLKSQIDGIINSYIGKWLMMVIPSQFVGINTDIAQINSSAPVNKQASQGLPYSYTTGRDWHRHCIHGTVDDKAFTMNLICWQPDNLLDLQDIAAWYAQEYGFHHALFISLKGEARVWHYEEHRIKGQTRLDAWKPEHVETYGQMVVDNSIHLGETYRCISVEADYRAIRAPRCERSHLEDFGQFSNHLGADYILFVPAFTHAVHGRMMQQYLAFLDVPYDKIYHACDSGESILYYALYIRQWKLKTVLDVMALLFEDININPVIYVTPEGNLYELGSDMSIHRNCGVFSRSNYESIFNQSGKNRLQIQIDEDFQYNRPSMFLRMGGATILSRLIN
ncbi:MAG: hypothetical protein E6664_00340 [Veillonella sp.]|jgi:hypothetical protein|nr:hypothetical protein [Veillonella sp.]